MFRTQHWGRLADMGASNQERAVTNPIETNDSEPTTIPLSGEKRKTFEAQLNEELYASASRYANVRAEGVARAGGLVDDQYVDGLVHNVLADTFLGILEWDETRASLLQHVLKGIKSRSRHDRKRAAEFQRISLDVHDSDERSAIRAEYEALLSKDEPDPNVADRARSCLSELRRLAIRSRDHEVLLLLEALEGGAHTREEFLADTGLTSRRYRNARQRLGGLVEELPATLAADDVDDGLPMHRLRVRHRAGCRPGCRLAERVRS